MANLGEINVRITADVDELKKRISDAEKKLDSFNDKTGKGGVKAAGQFKTGLMQLHAGLGIVSMAFSAAGKAAKAFHSVALAPTEIIARQSALAKSLDATVTGLRAVNQAAADRNIDGLDGSLARLNRRLGAVENGTGPAVNAVRALNLNTRQLAAADADERIALISDAIKGFGGSSQQATRYLQDLGFQQQGVYELFREGGDEIRRYRDAIEGMGRGVSEIDAQVLENVNLELQSLGDGFEGLKTQIAVNFAPVVGELGRMFNDWSTQSVDGVSRVDKVMEYLFKGIKFVGDGVEVLKRVVTISMNANRLAVAGLGEIFMWVVDKTIRPLIEKVQKIFEGLGKLQHIPGLGAIGKGAEAAAKGLDFVGDGIDVVKDKLAEIRKDSLDGLKQGAGGLFDDLTWGSKAESFAKEARTKAQEIAGIQIEERRKADEESRKQGNKNWDNHYSDLIRQKEQELELAKIYGSREREEIELQHEIRQAELEKAFKANEISWEEHQNEMLHAREVYNAEIVRHEEHLAEQLARIQEDMTRNEEAAAQRRRMIMMGAWNAAASLMDSHSKGMFKIGKAAAISQAAVNTALGITEAWKLGPIIGPPLAALVGAAGYGQIQNIKKQKYGSGGVAMGGDVAASVEQAAPQKPTQNIHVKGVDLDSWFSGEQMGNLLNQFVNDGGVITGWS